MKVHYKNNKAKAFLKHLINYMNSKGHISRLIVGR